MKAKKSKAKKLPPKSKTLAKAEIPGKVRVTFQWIGEGMSGDYNPDDPKDIPVLRFDVEDLSAPDPEETVFSYATAMSARLPKAVMKSVAQAFANALAADPNWKHVAEGLTWMDDRAARNIHGKV
jgi:hypothetical protein